MSKFQVYTKTERQDKSQLVLNHSIFVLNRSINRDCLCSNYFLLHLFLTKSAKMFLSKNICWIDKTISKYCICKHWISSLLLTMHIWRTIIFLLQVRDFHDLPQKNFEKKRNSRGIFQTFFSYYCVLCYFIYAFLFITWKWIPWRDL